MQIGIPVSTSLDPILEAEDIQPKMSKNKKRLLTISGQAILIAACISFIFKFLVHLIDLITNVSFHGSFSYAHSSPANNSIGLWMIVILAIGGVVVGLMAPYGSKAIRGHGIPEAMEQILTNQFKLGLSKNC